MELSQEKLRLAATSGAIAATALEQEGVACRDGVAAPEPIDQEQALTTAARSDLIVHIANFLGLGELMEDTPAGGMTRTLTKFRLARRKLELRQNPDMVLGSRQEFGGACVPSSTITVKGVAEREQDSAVRLVQDLCWLLSLASMSRVIAYRYDYPAGTMAKGWSVPGVCGKSWTLIDIRDGAHVRRFLEGTFSAFRRLKTKRQLPAFIDALISAETGNHPVEISLVTAYVSLEMLKDSWARSKGIPFQKGHFARVDPSTGQPTRYGFEAMLRDMFAEVGMKPKLKPVARYRNALIHSGGLRLSHRTKDRAYATVQRLAREYVLRLLGYKGPYVMFGSLKLGNLK